MNKSALLWMQTKAWCVANPEKRAAIAMIDGQFEITWKPRQIRPLGVDFTYTDQLGDCVSCDGYILTQAEAPHCPTCARLQREGKAL